ncbi:MAG: cytochrome c3 family protein [Terriglobia bacterium]
MRAQRTERRPLRYRWLLLLFLLLLPGGTGAAQGMKSDVLLSSHNLSVTGPGPVTSSETDACLFCHTPHTSLVDVTPLWNHELSTQTYNTYVSSTLDAGAATPSAGVSRLCLSCHDGTVALGQTVSKGLIPTVGSMRPEAVLGTDLTNDHPLGIAPVDDGQLVLNLFQSPPGSTDPAVQLPAGRIECTSCHEPHTPNLDAVARNFLVRSNSSGAICLACHDPSRPQPNALAGWFTGAHSTSANSVPTAGSFGAYGSVDANACGNCHRLHGTGATAAPRLLRAAEETTCNLCHAGASLSPPLLDVLGEFSKPYAHPTATLSGQHDPAENAFPLDANRHAECADCHNPHAAGPTDGTEVPPGVEAPLLGASGFNGISALRPATNEYEICFKCHADSTNKPQDSPGFNAFGRTPTRVTHATVADPFNERLRFESGVSRHNVSTPRQRTALEVPSLRPFLLNLDGSPGRSLGPGTHIYCTDCHANDQARKSNGAGPNGPHGSLYPHLLERRYDLEGPPSAPGGNDGQSVPYIPGLNGSAGLCTKCHDVDNSILADRSFGKHRRHIERANTSCSTCHDPHGIHGGTATENFNLVNFDVAIVGPTSGGQLRIEDTDPSGFGGSCYLTCHSNNHNGRSY